MYFFFHFLIYLDIAKPRLQKKSSRSSLPEMTSANFNRQSYVPYHSLSIATCTCSQFSIAFFNTILYLITAFQMLIVIAMPEMFQQCLQEREVERVLYETLCCNCEQVSVVSFKWKHCSVSVRALDS